ncbi:MAG: sugar ABC transporter permease [Lachnospiraceae bacterium]|nr:sugar ABC transporter permease [Lachnospiraceae bacterium]
MNKKKVKKIMNNWQLYVMVLPALLYIILFAYKPMYGIQIAFRDFTFKGGITGSEWVGFAQFERLFNSYWFPVILKNTLSISFLNLIVNFPLPIVFALMANELKNEKVKRTLQTVSYAPHFISTVVMCGMAILFLSPSSGIINKFIMMLGGEAIAFMSEPKLYKWIYVLTGVWQGTGWSAIIYFSALSGVDKSLLEAAEIDGATRLQRIWYINVPTILPTIIIQIILQCGRIMSLGQEKVLGLQNNMNLNASEVINTYVYKVGLQQYAYSFSTAAGLFNSVCNCILLVSVNQITKRLTKQSLW